MINKEFLDSLIKEKQNGLSNETIRTALRKSKWSEEDIEEVIKESGEEKIGYQYTPPKKNHKQIIVIILIIIIYPIGIALMWTWMKNWRLILKITLSILFGLLTLILFLISPLNPFYTKQINNFKNSIIYETGSLTTILTENFPTLNQILNPTKPAYYAFYSFTAKDEKRIEAGLSSANPHVYLSILAPPFRAKVGSDYAIQSGGIFLPGTTVKLLTKTIDLRDNGINIYGDIQASVSSNGSSTKYLIGLLKVNDIWYVTFVNPLGNQ